MGWGHTIPRVLTHVCIARGGGGGDTHRVLLCEVVGDVKPWPNRFASQKPELACACEGWPNGFTSQLASRKKP